MNEAISILSLAPIATTKGAVSLHGSHGILMGPPNTIRATVWTRSGKKFEQVFWLPLVEKLGLEHLDRVRENFASQSFWWTEGAA